MPRCESPAGPWRATFRTVACTSKSGLRRLIFDDFDVKSGSCYSRMLILSTSSSKSGPRPSVFDDFSVKSSARYSLVHILWTTFPLEGVHPRKQTFSSGDNRRTQGLAPESVFSREFTRSRSLTSQLLDGDVIDMMM